MDVQRLSLVNSCLEEGDSRAYTLRFAIDSDGCTGYVAGEQLPGRGRKPSLQLYALQLIALDASGLLLVNSCLVEGESQAYSSTLCN